MPARDGLEELDWSTDLGGGTRVSLVQAGIFRRGQAAGVLRDGDPEVLARLFSGLVGGYQSTDPAVVAEPMAAERLPLTALHEVVDGAFGA